jgi:hypothetical protein
MPIARIFVATALSLAGAAVLAATVFSGAPNITHSAGDEPVAVTAVIVREIEAAQRKAEAEMLLRIEARTTNEIGSAEAARTLRW